MMRRFWALFCAASLLSLCASVRASDRGPAIVVLASDGGIGIDSGVTARQIVCGALAERGQRVQELPGFDRVRPVDASVQREAAVNGAARIYVLRIAPLGKKLVVDLALLTTSLETVRSVNMSSAGPEELDVVLPRLVAALVGGGKAGETAEVDTVTTKEAKKWEKKPGEFLFGLGIMLGGVIADDPVFVYGFDARIAYEMKHFRIDFQLGGMLSVTQWANAATRAGVGAAWLPLASDWSPYLGATLDYQLEVVNDDIGGGVGADVYGGIELFRLHAARMLIQLGCMLPFYALTSDQYTPVVYGAVMVLW